MSALTSAVLQGWVMRSSMTAERGQGAQQGGTREARVRGSGARQGVVAAPVAPRQRDSKQQNSQTHPLSGRGRRSPSPCHLKTASRQQAARKTKKKRTRLQVVVGVFHHHATSQTKARKASLKKRHAPAFRSWSAYSITMNTASSEGPTTTSLTFTMCGWLRLRQGGWVGGRCREGQGRRQAVGRGPRATSLLARRPGAGGLRRRRRRRRSSSSSSSSCQGAADSPGT